ncbi:MAG: tRNA-intron lyase [archaeon]|nr:MAG: tRNA-intron lyase [archaeon]
MKKGIATKKGGKFKATISGDLVISNEKEAVNLHNKNRFGELVGGKIQYSLSEALYLLEQSKIEVHDSKKRLSYDAFLKKAKRLEPNIILRYKVFADLRKRGFIVKTALKFGADFRVYERGKKPGKAHAKWLVSPVKGNSKIIWYDLAAKSRVAHSTKKNLLIAVVDDEGDITYYEVGWIKP